MFSEFPAFADRRAAGRTLAAALAPLVLDPCVVVALTRNAVPVAFEIARALEASLALFKREDALPAPELVDRTIGRIVVLVDDGAADASELRSALTARRRGRTSLVYATPVASKETLGIAAAYADQTVCLLEPDPFYGVGAHFGEFHRVSGAEVARFLHEARDPHASPAPPLAPPVIDAI